MAEEGRVHPDCRNASNPYHECSDYCFKIIAEAKKKTNKSDIGSFFVEVLVSSNFLKLLLMDFFSFPAFGFRSLNA